MKKLFILAVIVFIVSVNGFSGIESEVIAEVSYIKLEMSVSHKTEGGKVYVIGKSNLPPETKIGITLFKEDRSYRAQDFNIYINKDGAFKSTGFSNKGNPIYGKLKAKIIFYNNSAWQKKEIIKKLNKYKGSGLENGDMEVIYKFNVATLKGNTQEKQKLSKDELRKFKNKGNSLLKELLSFKNDIEFHEVGFGLCCKYNAWLRKSKRLEKEWMEATNSLPIQVTVSTEYSSIAEALSWLKLIGLQYAKHAGTDNSFTKNVLPKVKKAFEK